MTVTSTAVPGDNLQETLVSTASTEGVEGICLLAAPDEALLTDGFESTLQSLSVPVFGGIFPEIIHHGTNTDSGALVVGLSVAPHLTTVEGLSDPETAFRDTLDPTLPAAGYQTAFVFIDAYSEQIEQFIEALFRTYSVELNVIGGGAGTLSDERHPCLFTNDGLISDAAVIAAVPAPTTIGVNHGYTKIAGPFRVTDAEGSTLHSLDASPAFELYQDVIERHAGRTVTPENFFGVAKSYPFGISRLDGEQLVRDPFAVDDGSMSCFGTVPEGEFLSVLTGDADSLVAAAHTAADHATSGRVDPELLLFFDCISQVLYLEDDFDRELAAVTDHEKPVVGALTIGEIANDGAGHLDYFNKTAVVGAIQDV